MTFFFSISFTLNGSTRVTGLGTLRCGQREADQTKNHGDHEGMSAMLVRIEHHQTAWGGGDASRQEKEQIKWAIWLSTVSAHSPGDSHRHRPTLVGGARSAPAWRSYLHDLHGSWFCQPHVGRTATFQARSLWCCRSKRSEEHTSELQSRLHLVCRLLLEK